MIHLLAQIFCESNNHQILILNNTYIKIKHAYLIDISIKYVITNMVKANFSGFLFIFISFYCFGFFVWHYSYFLFWSKELVTCWYLAHEMQNKFYLYAFIKIFPMLVTKSVTINYNWSIQLWYNWKRPQVSPRYFVIIQKYYQAQIPHLMTYSTHFIYG